MMLAMRKPVFTTDATRWAAVERRDANADGAFVYAVRTTGVFCRPSCGSRRPNRGNVVFFEDAAGAIRGGYRPCKRCGGATAALPEPVRRACRSIESAEASPTLDELAAVAGTSPAYFHRLFKKTVGVTPKGYADSIRQRKLRDGLATDETVTRTIHAAGYRSAASVYHDTPKVLGMTPTQYKNGAAGLRVRYTLARCSLGWVIVAATDRGICLTHLADRPEDLMEILRRRFPQAEQCDDRQLAKWVKAIVAQLEAPAAVCDLPLDIRGTAFQRQVWEALREIPLGETVSYAEIARRIGRPKAVRAVGSACGKNPVAPVIPCHRVLASDGTLGGYGFGLDRKRTLLDREKGR